MERFKRKFYDSHPTLPLDPDSDQLDVRRPIHTDSSHMAVVAFGAFFGTYARYELGILVPAGTNDWPLTTMLINISGAFLLGLLLQSLLRQGSDEGGRRIMRLLIGTGFLGAFTTYSSLATSVALLAQHHEMTIALLYALSSVLLGIIACALGIQLATSNHAARKDSKR